MAGISSKAFGKLENKKEKFQGQEFNDALDVNYYDFKYRNHDPQIGRFMQIDPLADKYVYNSTYAFSENRVISGIELEGLEWIPAPTPNAGNTRAVANLFRPEEKQVPLTQINKDSKAEYAAKGSTLPLVMATLMPASIAIPFMISYLTGVPVTPAPQAMSGTVGSGLSTISSTTDDAANSALLATKARVFEAGGEIGVLEGMGNLKVDKFANRIGVSFTHNEQTVMMSGDIVEDGKNLSITGFHTETLENGMTLAGQNTIGPEQF